MSKNLKVLLWVLAIAISCLVILYINGVRDLSEKAKTKTAIDVINSRTITLDDVMGKNLPPQPDQVKNDSTIAGIDANNNGIRDDVELTIFKKYPASAKIRAAELQYAEALQLELTEVFNTESLTVALRKEDLAYDCIGQADDSDMQNHLNEVKNWVINNTSRSKQLTQSLSYMESYSLSNGTDCDIDLSSLPN
jgi:hypothetical protein